MSRETDNWDLAIVIWRRIREASYTEMIYMVTEFNDLDIINTFEKFPTCDATLVDVEKAVEFLDLYCHNSPVKFIHLILPVWQRINTLQLSRHCLITCALNLEWVFEPAADIIVGLIRESYICFPELELEIESDVLINKILECELGDSIFYVATLAYQINDYSNAAVEVIVSELIKRRQFSDAIKILRMRRGSSVSNDILISSIINKIENVEGADVLDFMIYLSDSLARPISLAGYRLGIKLSESLNGNNKGVDTLTIPRFEPVRLAKTAMKARSVVGKHRFARTDQASEGSFSINLENIRALLNVGFISAESNES